MITDVFLLSRVRIKCFLFSISFDLILLFLSLAKTFLLPINYNLVDTRVSACQLATITLRLKKGTSLAELWIALTTEPKTCRYRGPQQRSETGTRLTPHASSCSMQPTLATTASQAEGCQTREPGSWCFPRKQSPMLYSGSPWWPLLRLASSVLARPGQYARSLRQMGDSAFGSLCRCICRCIGIRFALLLQI